MPLPFFSFTGSKDSFAGDLNFYGMNEYKVLNILAMDKFNFLCIFTSLLSFPSFILTSYFGTTGKAGMHFYTKMKTVIQQWKGLSGQGVCLAMPTK